MTAEVIISADSHVFEPIDLWEKRMDRRFRDRGPRYVANWEGKPGTWFVCEGATPRSVASIAAVGVPKEDLVKFAGASYQDLRPGGYDPVERLKDQEIDGVCAEVLYPTYAMGLYAVPDAELQEAAFDAYNDWLVELCSHAPARLAGIALISVRNVEHAVRSVHRWRKAGLRGAMVSCVPPEGTEYSDPVYDPLWSTFEDLAIPVSIHTLTSSRGQKHRFDRSKRGAASYPENPMEVMLTLGELTTATLLDRHPRLKIVLAEADIGWLPWMLARLDRGHSRWARQNGIVTELKPSEYFRRNFSAAFIKDREGVFARDFIGVDNLMWSSDYPHTDSTWPHSRDSIAHDLQGVSQAERRKLVCTNAARLYGFELAAAA